MSAPKDSGIPSLAQLPDGIGNAMLGPRLVVVGDSITAGATQNIDTETSGSLNQGYGPSYANLTGFLAGDRVRLVHNAGIGGDTTTQMLARFNTSVTPFKPDVVLFLGGTNDSNFPVSTTTSNIKQFIANCLAIGATPIIGTIPPAATTITNPAYYQNLLLRNAWIRAYCRANKILMVDFFRLLVDPVTGGYKAQYTLTVSATGGNYTITLRPYLVSGSYVQNPFGLLASVTTGNIAYNATAAQVQSAINATSSDVHVVVTGPAGGPYNLYIPDSYPLVITTTAGGLSGGAATAVAVNGAQYCVDGTHPSQQGQIVMARAVAKLLKQLYPATSITAAFSDNRSDAQSEYLYSVSDSANLLKNGCFTYFSAPGDITGSLDGYVNPSSQTWNYVQDADTKGNWLSVSLNAAGNYLFIGPNIAPSAGYSDGHVIAFSGKLQCSGFEARNILDYNSTAPASFGVTLNIQATSGNLSVSPVSNWAYDSEGTFYGEATLPTGTTNIYISAFGGASSVTGLQARFAELCLINLTTFGAGS